MFNDLKTLYFAQKKIKNRKMNTNRVYKVTGFENNSVTTIRLSLAELLEDNNTELNYSLQMDLDIILDLKSGQALYIKLSRDNSEDLGVIKRM